MKITRRDALALGLGAVPLGSAADALAAGAGTTAAAGRDPAWRRDVEGRRRADLHNGRYLNPVLAGDRPDPTILKDGGDYYATFSSFDATPGLVIWHSRDLVNWVPMGPAPWSQRLPDTPSIHVIHAEDIRGPWSQPVDLGIRGYIDPGHVVGEDGRRYLFLSGVSRACG